MSTRQAFLLSPYRLPTDHPLMLGDGDIAPWLHGYLTLWHPAVLRDLAGPPAVASVYDHERPAAGAIFAVPESPDPMLPDDWKQRVADAGAIAFTATGDRHGSVAALWAAMGSAWVEADVDKQRAFRAIGLGYLIVETLFDAMQHEHLLATNDFWSAVQQATLAFDYRPHLQAAADRLLAAREVLYSAPIHWLDIAMPDPARLEATLPATFRTPAPLNLIASGTVLRRIREEFAPRFDEIKARVAEPGGVPSLEVCSGAEVERDDVLLPLESQLWNLRAAIRTAKELLGAEVHVFARRRSAFQAQTPQLLLASGYEKALLLAFDGAVIPSHRSTMINWSSPDNKTLDAFTRAPLPGEKPETYFNIVHRLHETIMQDSAATLALLHAEGPPAPWHEDLLELTRFGPVLGRFTTFSRYFGDATAGEYAPTATVDEFFTDSLDDRVTNQHRPDPVSGFAKQQRQRRRLDAAFGFAALLRAAGAGAATAELTALEKDLADCEDRFESGDESASPLEMERRAAQLLANRLQARAESNMPGFLLLNPCSFVRRLALELDGVTGPIPVEGPVKAAQFDGDKAKIVAEIPPFGFAWLPRQAPGATTAKARMKLADTNIVRNEFIEAEIDPQTGGLKSIRDTRTRSGRLGEQLAYNPGSTMKAKEVRVVSSGPAVGEVVSEGAILDDQGQVLASFRQRFRAWLGRPLLDIRIEIFPERPPAGYPWHAYYAARFAWRDERATLLRGVNGSSHISNHTRPVTPDYIELRSGAERTTIFPGGLPFHQRNGSRMLDVILTVDGEAAKAFDLSIGLEREYPAQTALGLTTPTTVVPTEKGPPHVGPTGWLFHLDAPNLLLTNLRPVAAGPGASAAVAVRVLENSTFGGAAEFRCVRNPLRALVLNPDGSDGMDLPVTGDAVGLDVSANDLMRFRVDFA